MQKLFNHKYNFALHKFNFNIVWLLFSAFVFRLFIANFGTLQLDHGTFVAWGNSLAIGGLKTFYTSWSDYLPGYVYILWLLGKINLLFPEFQTILFKLPAILADVATGYLIYKIAVRVKSERVGIILSTIYLFNPAIFANSALWGQVDSLTTLFILLALYIFPKSYTLSAVYLAIGTLIKPQAAFVLPAILYLFIVHKKKFLEILIYLSVGLTTFVLGFIPFSSQPSLTQFIFNRLSISANQYQYGSINAFSFWGLFGFWRPDNVTVWIGLGISAVFVTVVCIFFIKKKTRK